MKEYIDSLYHPVSPGLEQLRKRAEERSIPLILKETESLLCSLIAMKRPGNLLEVGTACGYSSLLFSLCRAQMKITTIELRSASCLMAKKNIEEMGKTKQIQLIEGDAGEVIPCLSKELENGKIAPFDFVFLDGAKGHYLEMWKKCLPLCSPGALIVSDNVLFRGITASEEFLDDRRNRTIMKRMREFLSYISTSPNVATTVLPVGDGVAISVLKNGE